MSDVRVPFSLDTETTQLIVLYIDIPIQQRSTTNKQLSSSLLHLVMSLKPVPNKLITQLLTSSRAYLSRTSLPFTPSSLSISTLLLRHGLISSLSLGTPTGPDPKNFDSLPAPSKRLWVSLKHREGIPVLKHLELVSKGSKRVVVNHQELGRLLTGRRAKNVRGVGLGEVLIVRTEGEGGNGGDVYREGWEAWRRKQGGEVVCRAG